MSNTTEKLTLSDQQEEAKERVIKWFNGGVYNPIKPIFRLYGYAGTGKTTIIKHIVNNKVLQTKGSIAFASYTGKAALVMREQGLPARTIHSIIYVPQTPSKKKCLELEQKIKCAANKTVKKQLEDELKKEKTLKFVLRPGALFGVSLLVIDEVSMVDAPMMKDLLSFKVPILTLGDPAQLPPVKSDSIVSAKECDVMLTQIHRQALDNPIIEFSMKVRMGLPLKFSHRSAIRKIDFEKQQANYILSRDLTDDMLKSCDQILVGTHKARKYLNIRMRAIHGFKKHESVDDNYPKVGDKLVCLKNDEVTPSRWIRSIEEGRKLPIYNGMFCKVVKVVDYTDKEIILDVVFNIADERYDLPIRIHALREHFESYGKQRSAPLSFWERRQSQEFDYGYALTVHKAQGSQWGSVILYGDRFYRWDRAMKNKWLYTAITRATRNFTLVGGV